MFRKRKLTTFHACELTCSRYRNNLVEKTIMSKKSKPDRRKKLVKQSKVGPEKAMPTRPVPIEEPSTSIITATQSRAHKSSDPPKPSRLQLIEDIEDCRTGQRCVILYVDKIYPGIMRRVMDGTKKLVVQCVQTVGQESFRWPLNDDIAEYELQEIISAIPEPLPVTTRHLRINQLVWMELDDYEH